MKTNVFKYFIVSAAALFLFLGSGFVTAAMADIQFYAVDLGDDESLFEVTYGVDNYSYEEPYTLQYSIGDGWISVTDEINVEYSSTDVTKLMSLRLIDNDLNTYTDGELKFVSALYSSDYDFDIYGTITVNWDDVAFQLSVLGADNQSGFSPVPIPAAWVFGVGLIGMIGVKRKSMKAAA
jgi:hypothetical protein